MIRGSGCCRSLPVSLWRTLLWCVQCLVHSQHADVVRSTLLRWLSLEAGRQWSCLRKFTSGLACPLLCVMSLVLTKHWEAVDV